MGYPLELRLARYAERSMTPRDSREQPGKRGGVKDGSFWNCREHGGELVHLDERNDDPGDWEEHWSCPAEGCKFERHVS